MPRLRHIPYGIALACLLAGGYGALHDQVSYTISPEYFTVTKFAQFHIADALHNRIGAALVGWLASWWMGLVLGIVLVPLALLLPGERGAWPTVVRAELTALGTAAVVGLAAVLLSWLVIGGDVIEEGWLPTDLVHPAAYARVAMIHAWSYAGGLAGLIVALAGVVVSHWVVRGQGSRVSW